jgi:hypothetical protein
LLRERHIPNDLNVRWSQRISVALVYIALSTALVYWPASVVLLATVIAMNQAFYRFLGRRRGLFFAVRAAPLHLFYFFCSGIAFLAACGMAAGEAISRKRTG